MIDILEGRHEKERGTSWRIALRHAPRLFVVTLTYLLFPSLLVFASFCPWPALMVPLALGAYALAILAPRQVNGNERQSGAFHWPVMSLALLGALLIGAIPPFAQSSDWFKHYALLNTLIAQDWPPVVTLPEGTGTLRYSLSYYVGPALVAKLLGTAALPMLVFGWTAAGMYLVLLLTVHDEALSAAKTWLAGLVFLAFSGADVIGTQITKFTRGPAMHIEWWAGFGELSSSITNLVWAPQHAISGWLAALLVFRYPTQSIGNAGLIVASVALWSPFCAIGLAPVLIWALFKEGIRPTLTVSNMLLAPPLLLSAALFLTGGSVSIPAGFTWNHPLFSWGKWCLLVTLEIAAIAASLLLARPERRYIALCCSGFLCMLTLVSVGKNNDLLMRGSIPALGILAALAATAIVANESAWRKAPLAVCLTVGVATPAGEVARSLSTPRIADPERITLQDITTQNKAAIPQYLHLAEPPND